MFLSLHIWLYYRSKWQIITFPPTVHDGCLRAQVSAVSHKNQVKILNQMFLRSCWFACEFDFASEFFNVPEIFQHFNLWYSVDISVCEATKQLQHIYCNSNTTTPQPTTTRIPDYFRQVCRQVYTLNDSTPSICKFDRFVMHLTYKKWENISIWFRYDMQHLQLWLDAVHTCTTLCGTVWYFRIWLISINYFIFALKRYLFLIVSHLLKSTRRKSQPTIYV